MFKHLLKLLLLYILLNCNYNIRMKNMFLAVAIPKMCRYIFSSSIKQNKYSGRQGKFMNKLMRDNQSKKKWFSPYEYLPNSQLAEERSTPWYITRRLSILNKLYMEHITDLMATGEIAPDILDKGIEITNVQISSNFKQINIYWSPTLEDVDYSVVDEILYNSAGTLRHELSQMRIVGIVPPIKFIKNKNIYVLKNIEKQLRQIENTNDNNVFVEITNTNSTIDVRNNSNNNLKTQLHSPLPKMKHDVLGLDHYKIITKIQSILKKSRQAAESHISEKNEMNITQPNLKVSRPLETEIITQKVQQQIFYKFLKKRKVEKLKSHKKNDKNIKCHSIEEHVYDFNVSSNFTDKTDDVCFDEYDVTTEDKNI